MRAQLCSPPRPIAIAPLARPETATGRSLVLVVPSPNYPYSLSPQHLTASVSVSAQLWSPPAAIAFTPLTRPETSTGIELLVVVPSPSSPRQFS